MRFTGRNGGIGIDGLGFKASTAKRSQSQKILLTKSASEQPRTSPPKFCTKLQMLLNVATSVTFANATYLLPCLGLSRRSEEIDPLRAVLDGLDANVVEEILHQHAGPEFSRMGGRTRSSSVDLLLSVECFLSSLRRT